MGDEQKTAELYESFVTGFLRPLFIGGTAQATRPLPPSLLEFFALSRPSDPAVEQDIRLWMHRLASEIAPCDDVPFPDVGAMGTAMALHDLAVLTDPTLDRAFARGARKTIFEWAMDLIAAIPPPRTRGEALARHTVLERALGTEREDTVVKNWAYTYRFFGRPPPGNVVAMPRLRFVKQQKTRKALVRLIGEDEPGLTLDVLLRHLIARSPVTELLRTDLAPKLEFGHATLSVLSDGGLRHGIVNALVKNGTDAIAQPFGHALRVLSALGPPGEFLYVAVVFLAELQLLEVLDARVGHKPRDEPAVGDEELFAAVLPALLRHHGPLEHLLALSDPDRAAVQERAELRAKQAGDDAVAFAEQILARAVPLAPSTFAPSAA